MEKGRKIDMIEIDGSLGEGGGQVLRTSLSLSMITGSPFRIKGIRAGRRKPGLMRQHLTCVRAAAEISDARTSGAELGSTDLTFAPGPIKGGEYTFSVGSAGSVTLVFQTVLPALMLADVPSSLVLEGGTHNPMAPSFDFLDRCFRPALAGMGGEVSMRLIAHGFFPAGGGRMEAEIQPVKEWKELVLTESGEVRSRKGKILLSHLPDDIGQRQVRLLKNKLNWPVDCFEQKQVKPAHGPGNAVVADIQRGEHVEVFTGFGQRNMSSGKMIQQMIHEIREYMACDAPVGEHLSDQLMLPLALSRKGRYRMAKASSHAWTNLSVIDTFLPNRITMVELGDGTMLVEA